MNKMIYLFILIFITNQSFAQHKTITLHYPNDSTNVVDISGLDSITIFICGVSQVDYSGKNYNTVLIGNQCWLKENLDVGTMISGSTNSTNNATIEKYCYNNDPNNCNTYGGLYQWEEVMKYVIIEGTQGICPDGWHIPTLAEFQTLDTVVNHDGNSLKEVGQGTGSGAGTNISGFSSLLAGNKQTNSSFVDINLRGHYWTSTRDELIMTQVYHLVLWDTTSDIIFHNGIYSTYGFNIRCIKD